MAAANLERLHTKDKSVLGRQLVSHLSSRKSHPKLIWSLSRLGARDLLYASIDRVIPPVEISTWMDTLLSFKWKNPKPVAHLFSQLCRRTADPVRDVDERTARRVVDWIDAAGEFPDAIDRILHPSARNRKETQAVFGETLPTGLILDNS